MENNLIDLVVESLGGWGWQVVCLAGLWLWVMGMVAGLGSDEVRKGRVSMQSARRVVDARTPSNETSRQILEVSDIAESRQHGRNEGEEIQVLLPPRRVVEQMDADVQRSIAWLRREGKGFGVEMRHEDE